MVDKHIKLYDFLWIMAINIICMFISLSCASYLRYGYVIGIYKNFDQMGIFSLMILVEIVINLLFDFNHHFFRRDSYDEVAAVIKEQFVFALCILFWLYIVHISATLSRLMFGYYLIINCILLYIGHSLLRLYLEKVYRKGKTASRLLLLTTSGKAEKALENILSYNEWYRTLVGVALLDKNMETNASGGNAVSSIQGIPVVADTETFMDYVVHNEIDEVLIMDENRSHIDKTIPWMQTMEEMGITVNVDIDIFDYEVHGSKNLGRVGKYAVVTFDRNVLSPHQLFLKRCLDIVGALVGLVILTIVSIFVVPAIKIESPGPAIFKQKRMGKNGRTFMLYKFRSMYQDAEERKKALMEQNEMKGLMFKMADDPRITKVGKFIRKTSIDELPQFLNILKGDMSLVGTRPPTADEFAQYEAKHKCRLSMIPGLTGMWQISGRSEIKDFDEVVKLDMEYIDNWTILKDLKIILKTINVVILRKGSV